MSAKKLLRNLSAVVTLCDDRGIKKFSFQYRRYRRRELPEVYHGKNFKSKSSPQVLYQLVPTWSRSWTTPHPLSSWGIDLDQIVTSLLWAGNQKRFKKFQDFEKVFFGHQFECSENSEINSSNQKIVLRSELSKYQLKC